MPATLSESAVYTAKGDAPPAAPLFVPQSPDRFQYLDIGGVLMAEAPTTTYRDSSAFRRLQTSAIRVSYSRTARAQLELVIEKILITLETDHTSPYAGLPQTVEFQGCFCRAHALFRREQQVTAELCQTRWAQPVRALTHRCRCLVLIRSTHTE